MRSPRCPARPRSRRVSEDVVDFLKQLFLVPNYAIVVFILPDCTTTPARPLKTVGGEGLPGVNDLLKAVCLEWCCQKVNMVVHDRSEERRVGKEAKARGLPRHQKKTTGGNIPSGEHRSSSR